MASIAGPHVAAGTSPLRDPVNVTRCGSYRHADQSHERGESNRARRAEGTRRVGRVVDSWRGIGGRGAAHTAPAAGLVFPKFLKPLRRQFRIAHRVRDVAMPEVVLN